MEFRKRSYIAAFICTILLSFQLSESSAQTQIDHWETVVYDTTVWKYFPGTSDPGGSWKNSAFDDNAWAVGKGGVGYGDNDDNTIIPSVLSVFLRKQFTISDLNKIEEALLHVDFDDGFVAYINGVEVARAFMGSTTTIGYNQPSQGLHEATLYQGLAPEAFSLSKEKIQSILTEGENVLAVQVHNENIGSSDLTARIFFSLGITDNSTTYYTLPSWFRAPIQFQSSDLPIVSINTNNQTVQDESRIVADMGIIYNGVGNRNNVNDPFNNYNGKISIELRGESSQMFPKKSFSIETQDELGNNLNTVLLDMPSENDWILYAPYTDKSMLRDVLTFKIGRDLGAYTPRTRFVELVIDGKYQGLYVLMERIKRDKGRVNIATLNPEDVTGDELTGGYILRVDKIDGNDYPAWTTSNIPRLPGENIVTFQYYDPEGSELVDAQRNYIKSFMNDFESALASTSFSSAPLGFHKYIDIPSFVDFMLVNEIGKNIDGYIFSTYLYKEKNSDGGKLQMGPLWDFNLAFGNVNYQQNAQYAPGWMWNDQYRMYWFRRMIQDPLFSKSIKCRWSELRTTLLTDQYFINAIDSMSSIINEARIRNFERWPILGVYIWPNQFIGNTYEEEITFLKQWITTRLQWMDENMPGVCDLITGIKSEQDNEVYIFPNPSNGRVTISFANAEETNYSIEIRDGLGSLIVFADTTSSEFIWDGNAMNGSAVAPGLYVVKITMGDKKIRRRILKL